MSRHSIEFILNDRDVVVENAPGSTVLLDYLRHDQRLTGSKEGCAEGDCGACTVLVGRLVQGQLRYETVNACIRFLPSLHGCHVVTIEHLRGAGGGLHPVQQAMVDLHASQCGFCTPGIVMSLYALWMANPEPTRAEVERALQGNLCRCTGYAPIIDAALSLSGTDGGQTSDPLVSERDAIVARLRALPRGTRIETGPPEDRAILPSNADDLAACLLAHPAHTIVAGATDVGLWVTKFLKPISPAIFIGHLEELTAIEVDDDKVTFGACVSYTDAEATLSTHFPHLEAYWDRIAGCQVRNMGTIVGNIANGSPIGDTPPPMIALGARIVLRHGDTRREIALEDFFVAYGQQDRAAGEFIESLIVPKPAKAALHAAYKVSKRRDEDITAVAVAINITRFGDSIGACRIAYGGMAGTPKRALLAERILQDQGWNAASFDAAAASLAEEFTPLSDMRASAAYRLLVAQNLLRRFFLAHEGGAATALSAA
ncbi:MAG: xanthine dehydrogenase small subunit [Pseudomonadota bacterium]